MKFLDFILGRQSNNSPNYLVGVTNTSTVKVPLSSVSSGLLGKITANMNTTSDQLISLTGGTKFAITDVLMTNSSNDLSGGPVRDAQWWTGVSRSGYEIANSFITVFPTGDNSLKQLSNSNIFINTFNNHNLNLNLSVPSQVVGNSIYFSLGTPQGVAATCDIYIYGRIIS